MICSTMDVNQGNTRGLHRETAFERSNRDIDHWNTPDAEHQNQADAKTMPNSALMMISHIMGDGSKSKRGITLSRNNGTTARREEQNLGKRRTVITTFKGNETAQSSFQGGLEVQQHMNIRTGSRIINKKDTTEDYRTKDDQDAESDVVYRDIDQQVEQENGAVFVVRAEQGDEHKNHDNFPCSSVKNEGAGAAGKTMMSDAKDSLIRIEEEALKRIFDQNSGNDENEDNSNRSSITVHRKHERTAEQMNENNSEGVPANNNASINVNGYQEWAGIIDQNCEIDRKTGGTDIEDHLEERIQRVKRDVEKNNSGNAEQHNGMVRTVNDREHVLHQAKLENTSFRVLIRRDAQSDVTAYVAAAIVDSGVSKMHFTETDKHNSKGATARTSELVNGEDGGRSRLSYGDETQHTVSVKNENRRTENREPIDGKWIETRMAQRITEGKTITALLRYELSQNSISSAHQRNSSDHIEHQTESHTQSQKYREFNEASSGNNIISETTESNDGTENEHPENKTALNFRMLDTTTNDNYDEGMITENITKDMNISTIHPISTGVNANSDNNEFSNMVKIEENSVTFEKNRSTLKDRRISESGGSMREYISGNNEKIISGVSSGRSSTQNYFTDPIYLKTFTENPNDGVDSAIEAAHDTSTKKVVEIAEVDNMETGGKASENYTRNEGFRTAAAESWRTGTPVSEESEPAGEENKRSDEGSEETENVMTVVVTKSDGQQGNAEKQRTEPKEITPYYALSTSERIPEHLRTMELFGSVEGHVKEGDTTQAHQPSEAKDTKREFIRTTNEVSEEDHKHHSSDKLNIIEDEKYNTKTTSEAEVGISHRTRGTTEEKTSNAHTKGITLSTSRLEERITQIKRHGYTMQVGKDEYGISHETTEGLHDLTSATEYDSTALSTEVLPMEKEQPSISNALSRPIEVSQIALRVMSTAGAEIDERHDNVDHSTEISRKHGLFPTATTKKTMISAQTTIESSGKNEARSMTDITGQDRTVSPTAGNKVTPNEDYLTHEKSDSEVINQRSETTQGTDEGDSTTVVNGLTTVVTLSTTFNYSAKNPTSIHAYDVRRSPLLNGNAVDGVSTDYYDEKEHHRTSEQTKSTPSTYDRIAQQQDMMTKYNSMHVLATHHTQPLQTIEHLGVGSNGEISVDENEKHPSPNDLATSNGERIQSSNIIVVDETVTDDKKRTLTIGAPVEHTERTQQHDFAIPDIARTEDGTNEGNRQGSFGKVDGTAIDNISEKSTTSDGDALRTKKVLGDDYTMLDLTVAEDIGKTYFPSHDILISNGESSLHDFVVVTVTESEDKFEKHHPRSDTTASEGRSQSHIFSTAVGSETDNTAEVLVNSGEEKVRTGVSQGFDSSIRDLTGFGDDSKRTPSLNDIPISSGEIMLNSLAEVIVTDDKSKRQHSASDLMTSNGEGTQQGSLTAVDETNIGDRNGVLVDSSADGGGTKEYQQADFTALGLFGTGKNSDRYSPPYDALISNAAEASYSFTIDVVSETVRDGTRNPSSDDKAFSNGERSQPGKFINETGRDIRTIQYSTAGHSAAPSKERAENIRNQSNVYLTDDLNHSNIKNEKHSTAGFMSSFSRDGSELTSFTTIGVDVPKESSDEHRAYENKTASSLTRTSTETIHSDNFIRIHTGAIDGDSEIHLETNDAASFSKERTEGGEIRITSFADDEENDRSHATDVTVHTNERRVEDEMRRSDNSLMSAISRASYERDGFLTTRSLVGSSGGRNENQEHHQKITTMASTATTGDKSERHASMDLLVTRPEQRTSITASSQWSQDGTSEKVAASRISRIDDKNSFTVSTNKHENDMVTVESFSTAISQKISAAVEGNKPPMMPMPTQIYDSYDTTKEKKTSHAYTARIRATDAPSGSDAVDGSSENAPSSVPWQSSELNGVARTEFGESTISKSPEWLFSDRGSVSNQFTVTKESTSISAHHKITKSESQRSTQRDTSGNIIRSSYGKISEISADSIPPAHELEIIQPMHFGVLSQLSQARTILRGILEKTVQMERSARKSSADSSLRPMREEMSRTRMIILKDVSPEGGATRQTNRALAALMKAFFAVVLCPPPLVNLSHTNLPSPEDGHLIGYQPVGTIIVHVCASNYIFSSSHQPVNVYVCLDNGQWTDNMRGESCQCR
uniref:Uncharacterized protein n=2 Tax=Parascaris univalens TaxID=6257 RepID=A0A915B525_PARUN